MGSGFQHLVGLTKLTTLDLGNSQVTDAGLRGLAPLQNLTYLSLTNSMQITDAGLKELTPLTKLTTLGLSGTQVTGGRLHNLTTLNLSARR